MNQHFLTGSVAERYAAGRPYTPRIVERITRGLRQGT